MKKRDKRKKWSKRGETKRNKGVKCGERKNKKTFCMCKYGMEGIGVTVEIEQGVQPNILQQYYRTIIHIPEYYYKKWRRHTVLQASRNLRLMPTMKPSIGLPLMMNFVL